MDRAEVPPRHSTMPSASNVPFSGPRPSGPMSVTVTVQLPAPKSKLVQAPLVALECRPYRSQTRALGPFVAPQE